MTSTKRESLTPMGQTFPKCLKVYKRPNIYPGAWKRGRIQKVMLRLAGYVCEQCGLSDDEVLLHVHHIVWKAKHDCRWQNLVVVCVKCHVKIHNHCWQPGREWTLGDVPKWIVSRRL